MFLAWITKPRSPFLEQTVVMSRPSLSILRMISKKREKSYPSHAQYLVHISEYELFIQEKIHLCTLFLGVLSMLLATQHCIDTQQKMTNLCSGHRKYQTEGFLAITGARVQVCSLVDSSGKVKAHFIYQDFSSYTPQQTANWYIRCVKLSFGHKAWTHCLLQCTSNTFTAVHCNMIGYIVTVVKVMKKTKKQEKRYYIATQKQIIFFLAPVCV